MLSERIGRLHGSPVRAMLSAAQQPGMISFAGGLPAPESFAGLDLPAPPTDILQYGPTEGEPGLRARLARDLETIGLPCPAERILVLSGSQQGIDLAAKLLIDLGTTVAVESPTYLAALQAFRLFGARFQVMARGDIESSWRDGGPPSLAYVTPTFQNPSGACWTAEERDALASGCDRSDVVLLEDDPYRDLAYDPCERRPICARLERASWIYQGSFSKTMAPGLRLGFLAASADLFPHLVNLKQAADLHASRLSQWYALRYLEDPGRSARLAGLVDTYRRRRDSFAESMDRHLGGLAEWAIPAGGLFFWTRLKSGADTASLLAVCRERGVIFTPGEHFSPFPGAALAYLRLNFSHADEAAADRGLEIISAAIRNRSE